MTGFLVVATVTKESYRHLRRGTYSLPASLAQPTVPLMYRQMLSFILLCHPNLLGKKLLSVDKDTNVPSTVEALVVLNVDW